MPTLTLDIGGGQTRSVTVDDDFTKLSPAEQAAQADDIIKTISAPKDTSYGNALGYGLHNAETGVRATAKVLGDQIPDGTPGKQTVTDFGKAPAYFGDPTQSKTPYDPAGPAIAANLRAGYQSLTAGNYKDALGSAGSALANTPRALVEGAPDMAATLGAGAVGGALGGPVGGAAGVSVYTGARNLGENAEARAANNGRTDPTGADVAMALPATAAQAALQTIGVGRVPGVAGTIAKLPGVARPVANAALEGVAGATADAAGQVGNSLGTDKGVQLDPAQSAAAGLQAGAARGVFSAGHEMASATGDLAAKASGLQYPDPTVSQAPTMVRGREMIEQRMDAVKRTTGRSVTPDEAANSIRSELTANLTEMGTALRDSGTVSPEEFRTIIAPAIDQAMRHNKSIGEGADGEAPTAFTALKALDIPETPMKALLAGLEDLNTISQAARKNRQDGPFQQLGRTVGGIGSGVVMAALGHPIEGAITAFGGKGSAGSHVMGAVGAGIDRLLGTNKPEVLLRAERAAEVLKQNGMEAGESSLSSVPDATSQLRSQTLQDAITPPSSLRGISNQDAVAMPPEQQAALAQQAGVSPETFVKGLKGEATNQVGGGTNSLTPQQIADSTRYSEQAIRRVEQLLIQQAKARGQGVAGLPNKDQFASSDGMRGSPAARTDPGVDGFTGPGDNPQVAAARARASQPGAPPPEAPQSPAQAPQPAPAAPLPPVDWTGPGVLPTGWKVYVKKGLENQGVGDVTAADIGQAIDTLVQHDKMDAATGENLKAHGGNLQPNDPMLHDVIAQVALNKGRGDVLEHTGNAVLRGQPLDAQPGVAGGPVGVAAARAPIRDLYRYENVVDTTKAHIADKVSRFQAVDPELADTIAKIGAIPQAVVKEAIRKSFLKALPKGSGEARLRYARASGALDDPALMKGI